MFNFSLYLRCLFHFYEPARKPEFRVSAKRILVLVLFFLCFTLQTLVNWIFGLLDEIFFPCYRKKPILSPVFVTGVPRSGTTFMHRALAKDRETFTTFRLGELLFAPSLLQKYLLKFLYAADRKIGSPARHLLQHAGKILSGKYDRIHNYSLFEPDEDEILLTGIYSSIYLLFLFPVMPLIKRYSCFDDVLSKKEKDGIMNYYARQIRKHLYFHCRTGAKDKVYLAKSPAMICKVNALRDVFPGCRIIYMERDPLEVLPSWISMNANVFGKLHSPITRYPLKQDTIELLEEWLRQADEKLSAATTDSCVRVPYDMFTRDPMEIITGIYARFNITMPAQFSIVLEAIGRDQQDYRSLHQYSFESVGLDRAAMEKRFRQKEISGNHISSF